MILLVFNLTRDVTMISWSEHGCIDEFVALIVRVLLTVRLGALVTFFVILLNEFIAIVFFLVVVDVVDQVAVLIEDHLTVHLLVEQVIGLARCLGGTIGLILSFIVHDGGAAPG